MGWQTQRWGTGEERSQPSRPREGTGGRRRSIYYANAEHRCGRAVATLASHGTVPSMLVSLFSPCLLPLRH